MMEGICAASILVILSSVSYSASGLTISDKEYNVLPPTFHIDDYSECNQVETKVFCQARIKLGPLNDSSPIWKLVEATKKDRNFFNHDELFHAICVDLQNSSAEEVARTYSEQYKSVGLRAETVKLNCNDPIDYSLQLYDMILLAVGGLYVSLIIGSTYYDWKASKDKNKYVMSFSLLDNWRKFTKDDSEAKLNHVQGLRFFTTTLIIMFHSYVSYLTSHVESTEYFENFPNNLVKHALLTSFSFLVQVFFLFSGWFLSQNFFKNFPSERNMSKYIFLTFLNRYLRLTPVILLTALGLRGKLLFKFLQGPTQTVHLDVEHRICLRNWWTLLFFINNQMSETEVCFKPAWYVAADLQLYVVSLMALAIIWRCKTKPLVIFGIFTLIGIITSSVANSIYDNDVSYQVTPENTKVSMINITDLKLLYVPLHQNMATYMLGLALGYIHFTNQNSDLFKGQIRQMLWWISFLGLPSLAMVLSRCEFENKILKMVLAGVIKPAFGLGIGIGVLGMSHQLGGFLNKICSWKPFVVLGQCSYSTYLTHCFIVFRRTFVVSKPMIVTDWIMLSSFCYDMIGGFAIGVLSYLIVELPASRLQTLCVPRFKNQPLKTGKNGISQKLD